MKILLLNGGQTFAHSAGQLNRTLHNVAKNSLSELGHTIQETHIVNDQRKLIHF